MDNVDAWVRRVEHLYECATGDRRRLRLHLQDTTWSGQVADVYATGSSLGDVLGRLDAEIGEMVRASYLSLARRLGEIERLLGEEATRALRDAAGEAAEEVGGAAARARIEEAAAVAAKFKP